MFYIGRFGGINTQVRAISCFDSTITNTTGSRGSRQNSVHAGPPPKIHSPLHASTTSKNVFVRRPHRFQASDPLPTTFLAISTCTITITKFRRTSSATSINSIDINPSVISVGAVPAVAQSPSQVGMHCVSGHASGVSSHLLASSATSNRKDQSPIQTSPTPQSPAPPCLLGTQQQHPVLRHAHHNIIFGSASASAFGAQCGSVPHARQALRPNKLQNCQMTPLRPP